MIDFNAYCPLGENALVIGLVTEPINPKTIQKQWQFRNTIKDAFSPLLEDVVLTSHALTLVFNEKIRQPEKIKNQILDCVANFSQEATPMTFKKWEIPVCFEREYAVDLYQIFNENSEKVETYIDHFISKPLFVHHYGFLPGFCYLSGLDASLQLPRKRTPRLDVPTGSLAVGGFYAAIYPQQSPGGWHLIGRSPVIFFDAQRKPTTFAQPGDSFVFKPITKGELLEQLEREAERTYLPKYTQAHAPY